MILFCFVVPFKYVFATTPSVMDKLYVDQSVTVSGSGNSWSTAIKELRDALNLAHSNSTITEIWVAEGVYTPTNTLDAEISFEMRNNLTIYGGFKGNETSLAERDYNNNATILLPRHFQLL